MAKEKKEQRYYNGLAIDSDEEMMTVMWWEELMQAGYAEKIEEVNSYQLSVPVVNTYTQNVVMKTKSKDVEKNQKLLEDHVYTPEFKVKLTPAGVKLLSWYFHTTEDGHYSTENRKFDKLFVHNVEGLGNDYYIYIEVKPEHDRHNMTRLFTVNQKWMWWKHGIFVNLVQPHILFKKTFTPKAWLTTPTGKKRVIHWDIRSLDQWLIDNIKSKTSE